MNDEIQAGYDRLAPWYQCIERLRFGDTLQQARLALISDALECAERVERAKLRVLFLGDGDGRLLEAFVSARVDLEITSVDVSPRMMELQRRRIGQSDSNPFAASVCWQCVDIDSVEFSPGQFDIVVTAFFLDCFDESRLSEILPRIKGWLAPQGLWYVADFHQPDKGFPYYWARFWLAVMHLFFRWQTGLEARRIVNLNSLIHAIGFETIAERSLHFDMIRTTLYRLSTCSSRIGVGT